MVCAAHYFILVVWIHVCQKYVYGVCMQAYTSSSSTQMLAYTHAEDMAETAAYRKLQK